MPRVYEKKAGKDYPEHGIKKGGTYYEWSFYKQRPIKSKTRPKPSQLTQSKLSGVYLAIETLEEQVLGADTPDDIETALNDCADAVEEVAQEYRDSIQNMPENLQQSGPAEEMEDKASQLDDFAQELRDAAGEVSNLEVKDYIDTEFRRNAIEDRLHEEAGEGGTVTDEAIEEALEEDLASVDGFEDLLVGEQDGLMEDARELANGPSCPL